MSRRRGKADWREGSAAGSLAEVKSDWGKSATLSGAGGRYSSGAVRGSGAAAAGVSPPYSD